MNFNDIKRIYFIGIGGIGMSALARYFKKHGAEVHGYDRSETELTRSLAAEQTTRIAEQIVPLVAWLMPEGSRRRARTVAAVVVQMCYSLLHFSVHDDRPHPATVRELKRALRSYLRAVALDAQG